MRKRGPSYRALQLKPLFRCDNQCGEKTLSYCQLASVVVDEGDEAYTTNLCQKCFKKHLQEKGETPLSTVQWRQVVEKKAYRGRMWKMMGKEPTICAWNVEHFLQKISRVKRFFESWLTKKSRQEYQVSGLEKKMKASEWAFDRVEEAFEKVAQDEAEKVSIVQKIMLRSTDYLRRIIAPVGGQGGVTMSYLCPHCNSFPLEDYVRWVSGGKRTRWWCAMW